MISWYLIQHHKYCIIDQTLQYIIILLLENIIRRIDGYFRGGVQELYPTPPNSPSPDLITIEIERLDDGDDLTLEDYDRIETFIDDDYDESE